MLRVQHVVERTILLVVGHGSDMSSALGVQRRHLRSSRISRKELHRLNGSSVLKCMCIQRVFNLTDKAQ